MCSCTQTTQIGNDKEMVEIGVIAASAPDMVEIANYIYDLLKSNQIDSVIYGSVAYAIEVPKVHSEDAIRIINNDKWLKRKNSMYGGRALKMCSSGSNQVK